MQPRMKMLQRLSKWVLDQIVQEVPEDSALCEFDCRKGQCTQGEWARCERRLCRARGELMPASAELQEPANVSSQLNEEIDAASLGGR